MNTAEIEERFQSALIEAGLKLAAVEVIDDDRTSEDEATEEVETTQGEDEEAFSGPPALAPSGLFQNPEAHPYVLDLLLLRKYGPEWLEWEQLTTFLAIERDFGSVVSDVNMQKLQAVKTLHLVDGFWHNWEIFSPVTVALTAGAPDFDVMQVPTVAQCAVAVDIASRIRSDVAWSEEMKTYLEVVHKFDGIFLAIQPLDFVTVDPENYPVDVQEIAARWPDVRKSGLPPTGATGTDEQLRRLLVIHETLQESQADLRSQLALLFHG